MILWRQFLIFDYQSNMKPKLWMLLRVATDFNIDIGVFCMIRYKDKGVMAGKVVNCAIMRIVEVFS